MDVQIAARNKEAEKAEEQEFVLQQKKRPKLFSVPIMPEEVEEELRKYSRFREGPSLETWSKLRKQRPHCPPPLHFPLPPPRVLDKSVPQECSIRVSDKSALQECPTKECPTRVSVRQECPTRVSKRVCHKSLLQEYLTRVSDKSVPQECPTEFSDKSVPQVPRKSVPQECPTRVPYQSAPQNFRTRVSYKWPTRVFDQSVRPTRCTRVSHKSVP